MTSPRPQRPVPKAADYGSENSRFTSIQDLYQFFQPLQFRIVKSDPTSSQIKEGEIILQDDEATKRRIYAKINGVIWYWNADAHL